MDPLSVAASVAGLLAAGGKVTALLFAALGKWENPPTLARTIMLEVTDISAALGQLQGFLCDRQKVDPDRSSLLQLDILLATLTGCVTTYSDLQYTLTELNVNEDMGVFDRIKWLRRGNKLNSLLQRLQNHKSSLTLMLTIIQSKSLQEAQSCTQNLGALVEQMLDCNRDLANRIRNLKREGSVVVGARSDIVSVDDIRRSIASRQSASIPRGNLPKHFTFEDDLEDSHVYSKAIYQFSQMSLTSTALYTTALSVFSKHSLSQVSNISCYARELHNSELYIFGGAGPEQPSYAKNLKKPLPRLPGLRPRSAYTGSVARVSVVKTDLGEPTTIFHFGHQRPTPSLPTKMPQSSSSTLLESINDFRSKSWIQ
ncbi:hypothetical protein F4808DRAFT_389581 [Astrocystis sublimbata]|nr:hypothetical protein F4808DRAFT_389581 [Astrocystis sublimbata]